MIIWSLRPQPSISRPLQKHPEALLNSRKGFEISGKNFYEIISAEPIGPEETTRGD